MSRSGCVLVVCESGPSGKADTLTLEMLGLGHELARATGRKLCAIAPGDIAEEVAACGPFHVFPASAPTGDEYCPEWHVAFVEHACRQCDPESIIFAHSPLGQDIAARLAERLGAGLVTDCVGISFDGQGMVATKPVQGGIALATYSLKTIPQIVTVRRGVGSIPKDIESSSAEIFKIEMPEIDVHWELVNRVQEESAEIKLEDAEIVISGGRGIGGPEGFDMIRELAAEIGAAVGASRPPCDSGWIASSSQVGITGKSVRPDLYIAVGISGASQHLSGMTDSKVIVAINKDKEADIFRMADYGVVGDYRQIVPALTDAVKKLKTKES